MYVCHLVAQASKMCSILSAMKFFNNFEFPVPTGTTRKKYEKAHIYVRLFAW